MSAPVGILQYDVTVEYTPRALEHSVPLQARLTLRAARGVFELDLFEDGTSTRYQPSLPWRVASDELAC
ncbi:MAG: hypothetical protein ABSE77_23400 [Acidimicrobiales bacterium]